MARAAVAAGADGLIVEVHPNPDRALSDGGQSLFPDQFGAPRARGARDRGGDRPVHRAAARNRPVGARVALQARRTRAPRNTGARMQPARFRALAFAGALLAPLSLAAARPRAQGDLLDRAVAAWAKVKTARATFEQTITNSLTGRTLTATGEYQQQRPGKLSVRFSRARRRAHRRRRQAALALSAEHDARAR